jgi:hypothetical protein
MNKKPQWYAFQEEICDYFRSIGADAQSNSIVHGARSTHAVDVLVRTKYLGQNMNWIVEAKHWKSNVSKLHVLALQKIVEDIGADRGFIVTEKGFQSGAIKSATNSNVYLATFAELKASTKELVESEILDAFKRRAMLLNLRYWSHSKVIRKKYGLRGEIEDFPVHFSGGQLLDGIADAIKRAKRKEYPIMFFTGMVLQAGESRADNFQQLSNLNLVDEEILRAEHEMQKGEDFNPIIGDPREVGYHSQKLDILTGDWKPFMD